MARDRRRRSPRAPGFGRGPGVHLHRAHPAARRRRRGAVVVGDEGPSPGSPDPGRAAVGGHVGGPGHRRDDPHRGHPARAVAGHPRQPAAADRRAQSASPESSLAGAIVAPFGEEILFRGFATTAWAADRGPRRALVQAALFFAFVHVLTISGGSASEAFGLAVRRLRVADPGRARAWLAVPPTWLDLGVVRPACHVQRDPPDPRRGGAARQLRSGRGRAAVMSAGERDG